jgi:uncharacterized tellurite resistance protein B-like protein
VQEYLTVGNIIAALICAAIFVFFLRYWFVNRRFMRKRAALDGFSRRDQNLVYLMASAAKSDGKISRAEHEIIRKSLEYITLKPVRSQDLTKVLNVASTSFDQLDVYGLQYGLSGPEKRTILMAIFEIISADGALEKRERNYVSDVCKGLEISDALFESVWMDFGDSKRTRKS